METNRGWVKMKARVDARVVEGVVLVPHGWGGEANGNLLTDTQCREPIMGYPDQKSLQCRIRKAEVKTIEYIKEFCSWRLRNYLALKEKLPL